MKTEKRQKGFNLLELMIVIAIIAILAAIAVPSYSKYIAREKLRNAQSDLQLLSLKLEYRYQRVLSYPGTTFDNTAELMDEDNKLKWTPASDTDDFNFSTENASTSSYTLKATGIDGGFTDCVVTLTHDGLKSISDCDSLAADGKWI